MGRTKQKFNRNYVLQNFEYTYQLENGGRQLRVRIEKPDGQHLWRLFREFRGNKGGFEAEFKCRKCESFKLNKVNTIGLQFDGSGARIFKCNRRLLNSETHVCMVDKPGAKKNIVPKSVYSRRVRAAGNVQAAATIVAARKTLAKAIRVANSSAARDARASARAAARSALGVMSLRDNTNQPSAVSQPQGQQQAAAIGDPCTVPHILIINRKGSCYAVTVANLTLNMPEMRDYIINGNAPKDAWHDFLREMFRRAHQGADPTRDCMAASFEPTPLLATIGYGVRENHVHLNAANFFEKRLMPNLDAVLQEMAQTDCRYSIKCDSETCKFEHVQQHKYTLAVLPSDSGAVISTLLSTFRQLKTGWLRVFNYACPRCTKRAKGDTYIKQVPRFLVIRTRHEYKRPMIPTAFVDSFDAFGHQWQYVCSSRLTFPDGRTGHASALLIDRATGSHFEISNSHVYASQAPVDLSQNRITIYRRV